MIHTSRQLKDLVRNATLQKALSATSGKRESTELMKEAESVLVTLKDSALMQDLWKSYQQKFPYASDYSWDDVMWSTRKLAHEAGLTVEKNIVERSLFKVMHTLSPACTAFTLEKDKMSFH